MHCYRLCTGDPFTFDIDQRSLESTIMEAGQRSVCVYAQDTALWYYEWAAARGHVIAALLYAQFQSKGTPRNQRSSFLAME